MSKYDAIPDHMMAAIIRYLDNGIKPGDFLTAIIENNLKGAVSHADDTNIGLIPTYVKYFYNHAPMACWGSQENRKAWEAKHDAT
tara:strand:- start:25894 stop:26148 length:255 start_codon:yes stop_codon:yes gene_type:complete